MRAKAFLLAVFLAPTLAGASVQAETSSWSTATEPYHPAVKSKTNRKTKPLARPERKGPKPLRNDQSTDPLSRFMPGKPESEISRYLAPATGEEAAYIAFEQGQYLTALNIAERKAKEGDPRAHTMIGRIYGEGLGVPKDEAVAARWYARGA